MRTQWKDERMERFNYALKAESWSLKQVRWAGHSVRSDRFRLSFTLRLLGLKFNWITWKTNCPSLQWANLLQNHEYTSSNGERTRKVSNIWGNKLDFKEPKFISNKLTQFETGCVFKISHNLKRETPFFVFPNYHFHYNPDSSFRIQLPRNQHAKMLLKVFPKNLKMLFIAVRLYASFLSSLVSFAWRNSCLIFPKGAILSLKF